MHRRELLCALLGSVAVRSWAAAEANGLAMRLQGAISDAKAQLVVELQNVSGQRFDVWVADGQVPKMQFSAILRDGASYPIVHRGLYRPCGGLCDLPDIRPLEAGAMLSLPIALDDLLYVPQKGAVHDACGSARARLLAACRL